MLQIHDTSREREREREREKWCTGFILQRARTLG